MRGHRTTLCRRIAIGSVGAAMSFGTIAAGAAVAGSDVPVELWDRPRSGRAVLAVPAVRQAVEALSAKPELRLAIWHAPGAESVVQAEELKAWLVAHAIEPGRIALRADGSVRQALRLEIIAEARKAP